MKPTESARSVVDMVDAKCYDREGRKTRLHVPHVRTLCARHVRGSSSGVVETSFRTARRCKQLNTVRKPKSTQHVLQSVGYKDR